MQTSLARFASIFFVALGLTGNAHSQVKTPTPPLVITPAPISLHGGDGTAVITLTNQSPAAIPLALSVGPVVDSATHAVLSKAKATLLPEISGGALPASAPLGEEVKFEVEISGVTGASAATVDLFNGTAQIGSIPIVAIDAPLAISVEGEGASSDKPLAYSHDGPVALSIKNTDAESYHVAWAFLVDGNTMSHGVLDVPAGGSSRVPIKDPCDNLYPFGRYVRTHWFGESVPVPGASCNMYSAIDRIHPSAKAGVLLLSVPDPDQISASMLPPSLLPTRALPVSLVMNRVAPAWSSAWSYLYATFLLALGGFFSYLASSVLPNMQKIGDLHSQLQDMANRTTTISDRIDSYLRVILRLERSHIGDSIKRASPWIPDSGDPIAQVSTSLDTLGKRLTAAERLDDLRRKHEQVSVSAPPSVTDGIDANLQSAAAQLHSLALSDADLAAANGFLSKAQASLDMLNDADALAKQISSNVSALNMRIAKFPPNYYVDLKEALPGVFLIMDKERGYDDPKNIVRPMFFAIDHGVAAIQLALDYAMVRASVPLRPSAQAPAPGAVPAAAAANVGDNAAAAALVAPAPAGAKPVAPGVVADAPAKDAPPLTNTIPAWQSEGLGDLKRQRLRDSRQKELIELLGTLSWRALRQANLLIQEMREDIYEEDILAEIKKPHQAAITYDTQKTRPYLPVFFTITFKDWRFNGAAALRTLICHWQFPNNLSERSWEVCHYFTGKEKDSVVLPHTQHSEVEAGQEPAAAVTPETPKSIMERLLSLFRRPVRPTVNLIVKVQIRGQKAQESHEVPVPALKTLIPLDPASPQDYSRAVADFLRFLIAFAVALGGLFSGALDQLSKLDFISASVAIVALGFGANSIKNLLTQSAPSATPVPAQAKKAA